MDSKWRICRLAIDESGKVRWCFGSERTWSNKLKILIFVPLMLLLFVLLYLLFKQIAECLLNNPKDPNRANLLRKGHNLMNGPVRSEISYLRYDGYENDDSIKHPIDEEKRTSGSFIKRIYEALNNNTVRVWDNKLSPEEARRYQGENMLKYMDDSVNPCDDFYQYACGKWSEHHPIPRDRSGFDTFELVRENVDFYLRELLEGTTSETNPIVVDELQDIIQRTKDQRDLNELYIAINKTKDRYFEKILSSRNGSAFIDPVLKARYMYKSCMNEEIISKRGIKPLLDLLSELRYWPIIQNKWNESDYDLVWLLAQLRLYNNDILIGEWIAPDMNSDKYIIMLKQTSLGLPRTDYFLEEKFKRYIDAYCDFMLEVSVILGADPEMARDDVEDVVRFEMNLAKLQVIPTNDCQLYTAKSFIRCGLGEFQKIIPEIDWIRYFDIVFEEPAPLNTTIITYCLDYLKDLIKMLKRTPPRIVTNYVLWRFVTNRINNLDGRFNTAKQKFHDVLYGRERLPPRWRVCVGQTNSHLNIALGHLFVHNYFNEKSKNDTITMTKAIQESFKEILGNSEWLEHETKRLAIDKIDAMQLKIGYPDLILDKELLTLQYSDILVHPDLYFENCLSLLQHTFRKEHWKVGKPVNKNVWNTAPTVVNAYYSRHKNQIIFPAAILQPPFYHQHFPRAINYGGIGMTIGHEISHAFDNRGRLFDNEGKMRWWWTKNDTEKFDEITKCLVDQYNSFTLPQLNISLNGTTTQTENIADNSAIKQAYNAYMKWLQHNEDISLPNVNITGTQLFFISFAQVWCGNTRPEAIKSRLKASVHPPGRFRVLGTLRNFPEFSDVYKCPKGSPMNPIDKCTIW